MQRQTGFNIVYALTIYINLKYQNYIPNVCGCTYCKNSMLDAWEGLKCDFDEIRYGVNTEAAARGVLWKKVYLEFRRIHRKTLESKSQAWGRQLY